MKAKFTGHDTFPLRYGWLYKAVNYLNIHGNLSSSIDTNVQKAIVELGVGKNMVSAIRYWAECSGVMTSDGEKVTADGIYLLLGSEHSKAKDPYLQHIGSVWLIHFWLNFNYDALTSYRYFFNYSNVQHFQKTQLTDECIDKAAIFCTGSLPNEKTIKKDIDCFLNSYCIKQKKGRAKDLINEDNFSSPLSELNLVHDTGGGYYVSDLAERTDLPVEVFIYALLRFVGKETSASQSTTIAFDSLLTSPYSPGRIFRLSESGLGQKLDEAQAYKGSTITWIDSDGLRQLSFERSVLKNPTKFLNKIYTGAR